MSVKLARVATRTSLLYAFFAALWIVLSDQAVVTIWSHPQTIGRIATYKGWAFVAVTAALLYGTLRAQLRRWEQEIEARRRTEEKLEGLTRDLQGTRDELELRIRERTEDLRQKADLLDLAHDAIFVRNMEGRIIFWNKGAEEMYGWTPNEAAGREARDLLRTRFPSDVEGIVSELLTKERWEGELVHQTKDGRDVVVQSRWAVQRDTHGTPVGVLELETDITEHKRIEEERQRLAAAVENTRETVIILDPDFRIRYVNPALLHLTGYPAEGLLGQDIALLWSDWESDACYESIRLSLSRAEPWSDVCPIRRSDGKVLPTRTSVAPIRDEAGNVLYYAILSYDISEQQALEAQLRQSQKMEALGTLAGGVAHDFNNILAAIIGFTELTQDHLVEGDRDVGHYLERIRSAGLRGRDLVRQLLTFSRKTEQEKEPLQLSSIVNETVKLLRPSLPTTVSIRVNVKSESGLILAELGQIQQVLMNLGGNAADAMREKGGVLGIELSDFSKASSDGNPHGMQPGLYMKLVVSDTGSGIAPDIMDRIFDPFFTTKKLGEGSGLGLSIVHGIVKQSHGHITVASEPGKGSTFTVYFPKITRLAQLELRSPEQETIPTGHERILFVDDEEALVEMGTELLTGLGYKVVSRTSSAHALALLHQEPSRFDLVITDQTMPGMTGIELAREVLAIRPELPIILCTGFSYLVNAESAKAAGIKGFAMKPLTKREIAKTIRYVLENRS